ncbi:MAG: thiosulfate oxidation carrier complex protein SoxZ [Thioalkalivibrio sp.]|nr:thiosulfate oxidation carrier complex protein SoxZ [Thioalkalivibrio sp.]
MQSKLRATVQNGVTTVRALIGHPMEIGTRRDPITNQVLPRHFIQQIVCRHGSETVMSADWGWGVSTNPYLSFQFEGGHVGDFFTLQWIDNRGMIETVEARII